MEVRRYDTRTADRWTLALHRYRMPGVGALRRLPVMLCHGLGSNRLSFDAPSGPSLARFLAEEGYDVWSLDLRGAGSSAKPHIFNALRYEWSFRHYVDLDAPAGIQFVQDATGAPAVHWIGHSLGGMIAYASMVEGKKRGKEPPFASVTAMASPTVLIAKAPEIPGARIVQSLLTRIERTPLFLPARLGAPITGLAYRLALFRVLYNPDNMDSAVVRRLLPHALDDVPARLLLDYLTAYEAQRQGKNHDAFLYERSLHEITAPIFVLGGAVDGLCPPAALYAVHARVSSEHKRLLVLSRENGCQHDYGHHDILFGRNVAREVYQPILSWLDERDPLPA